MMPSIKDILRAASLLAVLAGGQLRRADQRRQRCSTIRSANHPITVEPSYQTLKLGFAAPMPA